MNCGAPIAKNNVTQTKKKKGKGCLIAAIITFAIVFVVIAGGVILIMSLGKPKNLGIKTSKEAYESALIKMDYYRDNAPKKGSAEDYIYTYGELVDVDTTLTSEEITSFFNYNRPDYYAMKNVQVRLNPDDTVEFSGEINLEYILDSFFSNDSFTVTVLDFDGIPFTPKWISVYAHASGGIEDGKPADLSMHEIKIMGVNLPKSYYATDDATSDMEFIIDIVLDIAAERTGGRYDTLKPNNGELIVEGSFPSFLKREAVGGLD